MVIINALDNGTLVILLNRQFNLRPFRICYIYEKFLGDRLPAGQQTLTLLTEVRILVPQPKLLYTQ